MSIGLYTACMTGFFFVFALRPALMLKPAVLNSVTRQESLLYH